MGEIQEESHVEDIWRVAHHRYYTACVIGKSYLSEDKWVGCGNQYNVEYHRRFFGFSSNIQDVKKRNVSYNQLKSCKELWISDHMNAERHWNLFFLNFRLVFNSLIRRVSIWCLVFNKICIIINLSWIIIRFCLI